MTAIPYYQLMEDVQKEWIRNIIDTIDKMDSIDKLSVYMDYFIMEIAMKLDTAWLVKFQEKKIIKRKVTKYHGAHYHKGKMISPPRTWEEEETFEEDIIYPIKLWENNYIASFDDFINLQKSFHIHDSGEKWKERGSAQRIKIEFSEHSIYDYYFRHGFDKKPVS